MALRGHESLVRLVGKRRRLTATAHCVGSFEKDSDLVQVVSASQSVSVCDDVVVETTAQGAGLGRQTAGKDHTGSTEWVQCPVCGRSVCASSINSHLDSCLDGTKKQRKCTQVTLSRFAVKKRQQPPQGGGDCRKGGVVVAVKSEPAAVPLQTGAGKQENGVSGSGECGGGVSSPSGGSRSVSDVDSSGKSCSLGFVEDTKGPLVLVPRPQEEVRVDSSCGCSCHGTGTQDRVADTPSGQPACQVTETEVDAPDASDAGLLSTWIVGRRYRRGSSVAKGMRVWLRREPSNENDSNAIEVVPLGSPGGTALGHIPRALATYLAQLLDNHEAKIQGVVTDVPEDANKNVPVNIFLKTPIPEADGETEAPQDVLECWQRARGVASESGLAQPLISSSKGARVPKYQRNFLFLLDKVLEQDSHLFSDDQKAFLGCFKTLSEDAQRLFLRLYQRKGPCFRMSSVAYADVENATSAAEELVVAKYFTSAVDSCSGAEQSPNAGLKEKLDVMNVYELKQLLSSTRLKTKSQAATARRDELIKWIVTAAETSPRCIIDDKREVSFLSSLSERLGTCVRVSDTASFLLWRLQRLFFLNGEQELSSFLLVDMGVLKYPSYKCLRTQDVFPTMDSLLLYEKALEVGQAMDMALESNDMQSALNLLKRAEAELGAGVDVPPERSHTFLGQFSAAWVYATVCTLGVSILERDRRYTEAVGVLKLLLGKRCCPGRRGYWTMRLSTDLEHLGRKEESLQVAERGVDDPDIRGGNRMALQRRVVRLGKPPRRWKRPSYADSLERRCREVQIRGRPLKSVTGMKSKFYGFDGQQCGVEELALQFYAGELGGEWEGVHSEGGIWMTFFGILMWDVLFADVPDVFQTSFQTAPLDLNTESFYSAREEIIKARLNVICTGDVAGLLAESWNAHYGTRCTGVTWDRFTLAEMQTIAQCIGGPGLSAICRLLAEDHKGFTGGMPDLLLWRKRPGGCRVVPSEMQEICPGCKCTAVFASRLAGGEAKLVEVKGPRDRLSEQQRAWILVLTDAGVSVEVCKVLENLDEDVKVVQETMSSISVL